MGSFEPICPHITKDECTRARRESQTPANPSKTMPAICDRIHFRPLLRPHTDPALGHCSYLNTCYSEPTYAQSPSIPPLPSHRQMQYGAQGQGPVSLPSGLGAGGRGKEKAPCRYLHFEVDWDVNDGQGVPEHRLTPRRKPYRLELGLGPVHKETRPVSADAPSLSLTPCCYSFTHHCLIRMSSSPLSGSIVTYGGLTTPCWASSMLLWPTLLGIST